MTAPNKSYIICATPRCGSHLLAEALQTTGIAGKPDEYFLPNKHGQLQNEAGVIAERFGEKSLEEFRQLVLELGSSSNNVFGIILHGTYLQSIINNFQNMPHYQTLNTADLFAEIFHNPKYIWIQRRDKVRQAISWLKASETGIWSQFKGAEIGLKLNKEPQYDYYIIDQYYKFFIELEKTWADFFETYQIEPFVVVYEELVEKYEQTQFELLDFLDISYDNKLVFSERMLQRQSTNSNHEWAQKYRQQKASSIHRFIRFLRYLRFKLLPD